MKQKARSKDFSVRKAKFFKRGENLKVHFLISGFKENKSTMLNKEVKSNSVSWASANKENHNHNQPKPIRVVFLVGPSEDW